MPGCNLITFSITVTQELMLSSWLRELFPVADSMLGCRCHDEANPVWIWLPRSSGDSLSNAAQFNW